MYFFLGIFIYKDYGVAWDEVLQDNIGHANVDYIVRGDGFLLSDAFPDKYYGPSYEIVVRGIGEVLHLTRDYQFYMLYRHIVNFITFFAGVVFFYLLCLHRFKNYFLSLLGSAFLVLSPRLFSDAFYNSKDTVLLAFFIITFYSMIKFFEKKTPVRLLALAALSAFTVDIRIVGVILPFFVGLLFLKDLRLSKNKKTINYFVCYLLLLCILVFAMWPYLWSNPIENFFTAWKTFSHYVMDVKNLYMGSYVSAKNLPWHYIPVWMFITTPPLYIFLFIIGLIRLSMQVRKNAQDVLYLLWFFLPLVMVIVFRSTLYNAWRHVFFVYPAFLLIALHGVLYLLKMGKQIVIFILISSLLYTAATMISLHPYEHLYFNIFAGSDMNKIRMNFETDYWGLSYRKGLEYILAHDTSEKIIIYPDTAPAAYNSHLIPVEERKRLGYVWQWELTEKEKPRPMYYMTTFFNSRKEPALEEVYSVNVRGAKIMTVYRW